MARIAGGGIFLLALAALCALALPRGLADLRAFEARMLFQSWESARRQPSADELALAHGFLQEARALDPGHPNFLENMARLDELRALPLKAGDASAQAYLHQALVLQRQAARLRPGSPYTWANVAVLKSRLAETDREFESALRHAALLGPWEPVIQTTLANLGFRHWSLLAPETQSALRANAARALHWQSAAMFDLARRTGRLDVLCALPGVARFPLARACI